MGKSKKLLLIMVSGLTLAAPVEAQDKRGDEPLPAGVSFAEERTARLVRLENRFGRIEVSLKGAQIRSYVPAGQTELLYRPRNMDFSGQALNHGGIPVCWPWFGRNGEPGSPPHGYARYSDFIFGGVRRFDDGSLELILQLRPTPENLKLWPHEVELDYRITLGPKLRLELETRNAGKDRVVITEGLHPYWKVSDRKNVRVDGLDGLRYCFADEGTVDDKIWKGEFIPDGHFDHVFRLAPKESPCRSLTVRQADGLCCLVTVIRSS